MATAFGLGASGAVPVLGQDEPPWERRPEGSSLGGGGSLGSVLGEVDEQGDDNDRSDRVDERALVRHGRLPVVS
jgi:hypothetical protein